MTGFSLMFNGNCAEALKTYEKAFGAKVVEMRKYSDLPPNQGFAVTEKEKDLVLHSRLELDGMVLLCADSSGKVESGNNMHIAFTTDSPDPVLKAWDILKEDGEIFMNLQSTFFASHHGSLRDKFGINWMFTAIKPH